MSIKKAFVFLEENHDGMEAYNTIIKAAHETDVSSDRDFQRKYNHFYRIRRDSSWQKEFYSFFERNKSRTDLTFSEILTAMYNASGQVEASFSSKMLATINPEKPVWDTMVLQNLGKKPGGKNQPEKLRNAVMLYEDIDRWYTDFLGTENARKLIRLFHQKFPEFDSFSDVKKIDFILWGSRVDDRTQNGKTLKRLQQLLFVAKRPLGAYYEVLEEIGALKKDYTDYSNTHPVNVTEELKRIDNADYDLCCALITMALREDYWNNGKFTERFSDGSIMEIIERMCELLEERNDFI